MAIDDELIDQLIAGYKKPEDLPGENGLLKQLTMLLPERAGRPGQLVNCSVKNGMKPIPR